MSEFASENVRRTMPLKFLVILGIVILLAGAGFAIYYFSYWLESPRYALWKIVRSIQTNDTKTLFQYIDLQAISDNLAEKSASDVDSLLGNKGAGAAPEEDQVTRLMHSVAKKFARFIAPKILTSLEPQIKAGVEKYLSELTTVQKAALSVIPSSAQIQQNDGIAEVTVVDPTSDKTYHFKMAKLENTDNWRIVEIKYEDVKKFIEKKIKD